jgi:hypothetical protein
MLGHGTNPEKIIKELAVSGFRHDGFSISKGFLFWRLQPDLKLRFLK